MKALELQEEKKARPPTFILLIPRRTGACALASGCVSASAGSSSPTTAALGTFSNSGKVEIKTVTL